MADVPIEAAPAYTVTARVLHWVTAALVLTQIPLGLAIANVKLGPWMDTLYNLHKSIGATLIPLVIIRLLYRFANPPPPLRAIPRQSIRARRTDFAAFLRTRC